MATSTNLLRQEATRIKTARAKSAKGLPSTKAKSAKTISMSAPKRRKLRIRL